MRYSRIPKWRYFDGIRYAKGGEYRQLKDAKSAVARIRKEGDRARRILLMDLWVVFWRKGRAG